MMENRVSLLIGGDVHLGGGRISEIAQKGNAKKILGKFFSQFTDSDCTIINLESPLIDRGDPIKKTGPNLSSSEETGRFLNNAGVNLVTLANNHIMDYGEEGLSKTLQICRTNSIKTVGAGMDLPKATETEFIEHPDIKIGIVNIAENEFGTTSLFNKPGAHSLNPVENFYSIQAAAEVADKVIVIVHGGHEHYSLPSPRQKRTYRFFVDAGADIVVGHHTHCVSGWEMYNGKPIIYSLGNCIFDEKKYSEEVSAWNIGMFLKLLVTKKKIDFELHPFVQNAETVGLRELNTNEKSRFNRHIEGLNEIIEDDIKLEEQFNQFCEKSERLYNAYIEPHSLSILHGLRNRNLAPSFLSKKKRRLLLNLIRCEAHRDILLNILKQ